VPGQRIRTEREGQVDAPGDVAWFCLRSQPKHERVVAGHLRELGIEVLSPRVRYCRPTRHGPVWVIESMFPNYLFARFDWRTSLNIVHYARGAAGIVHFGCRWPTVPEPAIECIRALVGADELQNDDSSVFEPGDKVELNGGALHGLEAVVTQVMPGQQRVAVLLDFLGRQTTVELATNTITRRLYR
jgi:transcriptional antiterminator RfaH